MNLKSVKNSVFKTYRSMKRAYFADQITASLFASWYYKPKAKFCENLLKTYVPKEKLNDKKYIRRLKKDLLLTYIRQNGEPEEYFRYGFEKLSDTGRNEYMLVNDTDQLFRSLESKEARKLFTNKYSAYETFKVFYKRDLIKIYGPDDLDTFKEFSQKHGKFIVKPLDQHGGHGIFIDSLTGCSAEEKFNELLKLGKTVVEELLVQDHRMAAFNPGTVNTIRVVTYTRNNDMKIIQTSMRIGCGNSVVDNGCLSCGIDSETGTVITPARMAHSPGLYTFHPDTGCKIIGSQIPCWEELRNLLTELVKVYPEQPVVGWDLALCSNGWTMIEANTRPEVQILSGEGIGMRKIIEEAILKR